MWKSYDDRVNRGLQNPGWWAFLSAVLLRPTWGKGTTGVVFALLAGVSWWRESFASEQWKTRLEQNGLLPQWSPGWWVCLGLAVFLLAAVRAAYRLWLIEYERADALETVQHFPKLILSYQDRDAAHQQSSSNAFIATMAMVRNVSSDTVFNVKVLPLETPYGKATFTPAIIDQIPGGGFAEVEPRVENASAFFLHSLGYLLDKSYEKKNMSENRRREPFALHVHYEDEEGNKIEAECALHYTPGSHEVTMGKVRYLSLK